MRQITAAAPGMVDFFAMLEVLRARHKPHEKVLEITAAYTQSAITPRTMTAAADGQMDAVRPLIQHPSHSRSQFEQTGQSYSCCNLIYRYQTVP